MKNWFFFKTWTWGEIYMADYENSHGLTIHLHLVKQKEKLSCSVMYHMQIEGSKEHDSWHIKNILQFLGSTSVEAFRTTTRLAKVHCATWVTARV
jgi:hypothetical protein